MDKKQIDKLQELYRDQAMVEQLKATFDKFVYDSAAQKALQGQPTVGMKEASEVVQSFFNALNAKYAPKKEKKVEEPG